MTHTSESSASNSFGKPRKATLVQIGGALGIASSFIALLVFLVALMGFNAVFMLAPLSILLGLIGCLLSIIGAVTHKHSGADDTQPISALFVAFLGMLSGIVLWAMHPPMHMQEPAMKRAALLIGCCLLLLANDLRAADYAIGADLSFLAQAEENGTVFKENGQPKPGLQIFKDHGYNWIRLRLMHTPSNAARPLPNDLAYTIKLAKQAKQLGFKFLLNYHYSDDWADPGKQWAPKAWEGKSHEETVQLLHDYTRDTIAAFREAGVMPDMVQPGNEVTPGMVWPDGRLPNWQNFTDLIQAGVQGVKDGRGDAPMPPIMIHIEKAGDKRATKYFYDNIRSHNVEYDVIGQSYYPWWHGSLLDLKENLDFMANEYGKDIMLVEVAYNWRPTEYRNSPAPFPESPEGQRQFLEEVHRIMLGVPGGHGKGIFWWEPAVPLRQGIASRGMFDDDGNVLPVIEVFDKWTRGKAGRATGPGAGPARRGGAQRGTTNPAQ